MTQNFRDVVAAALALILVLTFCLVILYSVVNGKGVDVPPVLQDLVFAVTAFFFGTHANGNGADSARKSAAATAAQIASQTIAAVAPKPGGGA